MDIVLSDIESRIVNSGEFNRLKAIHQKGYTYMYTPIKHSRYEHSLGVYSLACRYQPKNQNLRVACLFHDIAHTPFSHTLDPLFKQGHKGSHLINILHRMGENMSFNEKLVHAYITGRRKSLLRGHMSLDMLDNIIRDGQECGFLEATPQHIISDIKMNGNFSLRASKKTMAILQKCLRRLNEEVYYNNEVLKMENSFLGSVCMAIINKQINLNRINSYTEKRLMEIASQYKSIPVNQQIRIYAI